MGEVADPHRVFSFSSTSTPRLLYSYFTLSLSVFIQSLLFLPLSPCSVEGVRRCTEFPGVMKVCCSFLRMPSFSLCLFPRCNHSLLASRLLRSQNRQEAAGCLANWTGNNVLLSNSVREWSKKAGSFFSQRPFFTQPVVASVFSLSPSQSLSLSYAAPFLTREAFDALKTGVDLNARLRGYRFIALPHKYTGVRAGSLIDREQQRDREKQ